MTGLPVVYIVRHAERNEPLRHSLRSVHRHLEGHGQVWIAGYKPSWLNDGIGYLPVGKRRGKYVHAAANWQAVLDCDDIGDRFIVMNDDFFLLQPTGGVLPTQHRGPLADVIDHYQQRYGARSNYAAGMTDVHNYLLSRGVEAPVSYGLHTPMVVDKEGWAEALAVPKREGWPATRPPHTRTLYGNLAQVGGTVAHDVKLVRADRPIPDGWQFVSTYTDSWQGYAGARLRALFPDPTPWEIPHRGTLRGMDPFAPSSASRPRRAHRVQRQTRRPSDTTQAAPDSAPVVTVNVSTDDAVSAEEAGRAAAEAFVGAATDRAPEPAPESEKEASDPEPAPEGPAAGPDPEPAPTDPGPTPHEVASSGPGPTVEAVVQRPTSRDPVAAWRGYLAHLGLDTEGSKNQLMARVRDHEQVQDEADGAD